MSAKSIKAALDVDWRLPDARQEALNILLHQFARLRGWLDQHFESKEIETPPLSEAIEQVEHLIDQDTEPDPDSPGSGKRRIRQGGGDRQVSLTDPDMWHRRKSSSRLFIGHKRHVLVDADLPGLIVPVALVPGNEREYAAAKPLLVKAESQGFELTELHHDRGYLPAEAIHERRAKGLRLITKPPPPRGCKECAFAARCLPKSNQKVITLHPHEALFQQMADELATADGRQARRERVFVEHALARIGAIQGTKTRYRGMKKVRFHTEASAVVANLHVLGGLWAKAA